MTPELQAAQQTLDRELQRYDRLAVAYSGGVDSAFLAWAAFRALGPERMIAVLADSPSLSRADLEAAKQFAAEQGIPLRIIRTDEMANPDYVRNDAMRCFHCKDELFRVMTAITAEMPGYALAYGRNKDDAGDFRPGQQAAANHQVVAPLADAQLGKAEIRALAQAAGLSVWDKPAAACLASRLEYGRPVTSEALQQVEDVEAALHALGMRKVRVRHHGAIARIEIAREELASLALTLDILDHITAAGKRAGFEFVALDTAGYRTGSMNALLPLSALSKATAQHAS
jgi:uncharacterized protein